MKRRYVDDVIKPTPGCQQRCTQIGKRQTNLVGKIWFRRAIATTPYLPGHKQ